MDYRYHILTNIAFRHTYFANGRYTGFTVEPDAETQHHFKRLSLLFKPRADGFSVLYETGPGLERTRNEVLQEKLVFGFVVTNTDADFVSYTDHVPADIAMTILYLRNQKNGSSAVKGMMHQNPYYTEKEILHNQPPDDEHPHNKSFFVKPFAWMQIELHDSLEEDLYVQFKGKETVWRYILGSEHLQELSEPAIIHKDTKETFNGPVFVQLPNGERRMAFESKRRIPLSNKAEKTFQLVEHFQPGSSKYKIVMGILPNPDVKLISLVKSEDEREENIFSEIFI